MATPATPSMIMTTKVTETSPSGLTRSLGVIEVEKEFVAKMIDSFYKGLKRCISLVLKGSTTSFEFLKVVLTQNIETFRDFSGTNEAPFLELIMADFEKDVGEWHRLNCSDLTPFVKKELRSEAQKEVKIASQELKFLETEKVNIADMIVASNSALADANVQLEKAEAMIKWANFLISKAGLVRTEENAWLE